MAHNIVVDTTKDANSIMSSKKVIMAMKAVKRIQDKWYNEYGFEINADAPDFDDRGFYHWNVLITRRIEHCVSTINIDYSVFSKPTCPNYTISAYTYYDGSDEQCTFYWNEHLLSLLNEQINCMDDAICILEHPEEILA